MDNVSPVKYAVAGATALTNVGLLGGLVWSIATHQTIGLPITLAMLLAGFGYFSYRDYLYFFGKK
jgi:hypothetical protein